MFYYFVHIRITIKIKTDEINNTIKIFVDKKWEW